MFREQPRQDSLVGLFGKEDHDLGEVLVTPGCCAGLMEILFSSFHALEVPFPSV